MFLIQPLIAYTQPAGVKTWKVVSLLKTPSVSHAAWISADDGWLVWRRVRWKKITWDFQINNSPSWNWDGKKNSRNCWPTLFDVWFYFVFEFLIFRFCFIFLNFAKNIITICVCVCVCDWQCDGEAYTASIVLGEHLILSRKLCVSLALARDGKWQCEPQWKHLPKKMYTPTHTLRTQVG